LIEARTIKGHHGSHNLRSPAYLLSMIVLVVVLATLSHSRTTSHLLLMIVLLAAFDTLDLVRTLRTGRANTRRNGTATREHRPAIFWKYVYEGYALLGLCGVAFISILLWPDYFR
jgi:hypothetical protein